MQESITNVVRHSGVTEAMVEIDHRPTEVRLRITNAAAPQPVPAVPAMPAGASSPGIGFGLAGMRERVALLGGTLRTGPTQDGGFEVAATLPVTMS